MDDKRTSMNMDIKYQPLEKIDLQEIINAASEL
jgi:hypothetical protein